jgi:hypothetical protein
MRQTSESAGNFSKTVTVQVVAKSTNEKTLKNRRIRSDHVRCRACDADLSCSRSDGSAQQQSILRSSPSNVRGRCICMGTLPVPVLRRPSSYFAWRTRWLRQRSTRRIQVSRFRHEYERRNRFAGLRSPIGFQFRGAARKPSLPSMCAEPRVILRRSNQLETGANRLSDTGSASLLRSLPEFDWKVQQASPPNIRGHTRFAHA